MSNPTRLVIIHPLNPEATRVAEVAAALRAGEVVAVPTDTVYGLAADALNPEAIGRVFAAKGREEGKPLPVFVASVAQARQLAATWPPAAERLARAFWPGALTLAVAARPDLPAALLAGGRSVALRQPRAPIVQALLAATGIPLTGTSANRSGEASCLDAGAVAQQLGARIAWIVDGGACAAAVPSTVIDLSGATPRLVRAGAVSREALAAYVSFTEPEAPAVAQG